MKHCNFLYELQTSLACFIGEGTTVEYATPFIIWLNDYILSNCNLNMIDKLKGMPVSHWNVMNENQCPIGQVSIHLS